MLKINFSYLAMLFSFLNYSQSINCEYKINLLQYEAKNQFEETLYNKAKSESENYKIILYVTNDWVYSEIKKFSQTEDELNIIPLMLGLNANRYFDLKKNKMYSHYKSDSDILVESLSNSWEWELKNEKKNIENYECYKAIGKKEIIRQGKKIDSFVEVWYCPKINVPFGPDEFTGLPGLVFEVIKGRYQYTLKKIIFPKEKTKVEKPKLKIITEEEYLKKIKEN